MFTKLRPNQRFKHDETTTTIDDAKVSISPDGLVTITQTDELLDSDIVELKAGTIFKIGNLLRATRKIVTIDRTITGNSDKVTTDSR